MSQTSAGRVTGVRRERLTGARGLPTGRDPRSAVDTWETVAYDAPPLGSRTHRTRPGPQPSRQSFLETAYRSDS